jgi:hypothetical protein
VIEPPGTGQVCGLCPARLTALDHRSKVDGVWCHLWCAFNRR